MHGKHSLTNINQYNTPAYLSIYPHTLTYTPYEHACCVCLVFGCRPEFLADLTVTGTIHDYVVSMLCGLERCVMTPQNAASWGYFNTATNQWNRDM